MSYKWKRAAGYSGIKEENDHPWQSHSNENICNEGLKTVANFHGPKDWIVKYPAGDRNSREIIGFRCLKDDIPRNSLTEKCEDIFQSASVGTEIGSNSRLQRGALRVQQVLGQCKYIASLKGMDVSEIRQKLHNDEQEFLQQKRIKNADSGPIYYFVNPPTLKCQSPIDAENNIHRSESPAQPMISRKEKSYDNYVSSEEDEYSQEFIQDVHIPKSCEKLAPDIPEVLRNFSRGISSPTDYEEDDANINHFFNMVQRIQEKCDKAKADDKNSKK